MLVVLVGILLRVCALGGQSLWRDEGFSVQLSYKGIAEIIQNRANDNHAPLYFVFLHYWVRLFGDSEFSLRLPSVLFGAAAVYLLYRIGLLLFDRRIALLAAFLLSISRFNITHSREARMYSLVVMLVLLSMHAFLKLQSKWSIRDALGYLVPSVLLLYTHAYGGFFIIAQNAFFLFWAIYRKLRASAVWSWLGLQVVTVLLFAPWLVVLLSQVRRRQGLAAPGGEGYLTLLILAKAFGQQASSSLPLTVLYALLAIVAVWALLVRAGYLKPGSATLTAGTGLETLVFLVSWWAIPFLVPFVLSQITAPFFSSRYAIGVTAALYLLVAAGVHSMRRALVRYGLILVIAVLSAVALVSYYRETLHTPYYGELTQFLNRNAGQRDWVLLYENDVGLFDYYGLRPDLRVQTYGRNRDAGEVFSSIQLADGEKLWFVNYLRGGTGGLQLKQRSPDGRYRLAAWWEYQHNVVLLQYEGGSEP
jgi:uncharacterized membrane protein